jgi:hypothetical protein
MRQNKLLRVSVSASVLLLLLLVLLMMNSMLCVHVIRHC